MTSAAPLALITGGSGFIGSAIVDAFLNAGFRVRLALRHRSRFAAVLARYPDRAKNGELEYAHVESFEAEGAFNEAVKGVFAVSHNASPATMDIEDNKRDLLDPAINATMGILRSASLEPSVKAVVLTSSFVAYTDLDKWKLPGETYDFNDWNPMTYADAAGQPKEGGFAVYSASKSLSERAAWKFMEDEKPGFTLTTFAPTWVMGPNLTLKTLDDLRSTHILTYQAIIAPTLSPTLVPFYTDVRDIASAHLQAVLQRDVANGKRYILAGGRNSNEAIARIWRREFPEAADKIGKSEAGVEEFPDCWSLDTESVVRDLGIKYTPYETCVRDTGEQLFSLKAAVPSL